MVRINWGKNIKGHFRNPFRLFFKVRPRAQPFIRKLIFIHMQRKHIFHMKGNAPGLASIEGLQTMQIWPFFQGLRKVREF